MLKFRNIKNNQSNIETKFMYRLASEFLTLNLYTEQHWNCQESKSMTNYLIGAVVIAGTVSLVDNYWIRYSSQCFETR